MSQTRADATLELINRIIRLKSAANRLGLATKFTIRGPTERMRELEGASGFWVRDGEVIGVGHATYPSPSRSRPNQDEIAWVYDDTLADITVEIDK